jgi:hypothetical protein
MWPHERLVFLAGIQDRLFNNVVPLFNILKIPSSRGVFEVSTPWLYLKQVLTFGTPHSLSITLHIFHHIAIYRFWNLVCLDCFLVIIILQNYIM